MKRCWRRILDTVQELEELVDVYLLAEFLDKEPIMTRIDELRKTLEGSAILASKQHRLKVLLDDIAKYRYHAQTILRRVADAVGETEISFTLKQLD